MEKSVIVCVTLGGPGDTAERGIYCDGNGFGDDGLTLSETVTAATMPKGRLEYVGTSIGPAVGVDYYNAVIGEKTNISEWDGKNNKWTTGGGHGVILPVEEKQP